VRRRLSHSGDVSSLPDVLKVLSHLLVTHALAGCLDMHVIPIERESVAAGRCSEGRRDPLLGAWRRADQRRGMCEFFSNAHYNDGCGVIMTSFPGDFHRLDDNRYYFGINNSFNQATGECIGEPSFSADCEQVTLAIECSNGNVFQLELERVRD
jgi:hypothetical protein